MNCTLYERVQLQLLRADNIASVGKVHPAGLESFIVHFTLMGGEAGRAIVYEEHGAYFYIGETPAMFSANAVMPWEAK